MAESKGLDQFSKRMEILADGLLKNAARVVAQTALVVDQVAVSATPVDTGRARANWLVSIGSPESGTREDVTGAPTAEGGERTANQSRATAAALEQGAKVVGGYNTLEQGSIFLTNNVSYIGKLDAGSSFQAPAGMTAAALQAGAEVVKRARLLEG